MKRTSPARRSLAVGLVLALSAPLAARPAPHGPALRGALGSRAPAPSPSQASRRPVLPAPAGRSSDAPLLAATSASGGSERNAVRSLGGGLDLVVASGETLVLDTGDFDGVLDVRDLVIEEGGLVRVLGPHPLIVLAARDVIVRGILDLSGLDAKDVATLNTGNVPELGAAGAAGGGRGGHGSPNVASSSPSGGSAEGAFAVPGSGGAGGESGYNDPSLGKDARRPGGGGGGVFGPPRSDSFGRVYAATPGANGHDLALGALTHLAPPRGGALGLSPFVDGDPTNDFFGVRPEVGPTGGLIRLICGELSGPWAGAGGGGGGDAVPSAVFPSTPWTPASDEKGGAGGGGGGALRVRAHGRIVFGLHGQILADGGDGARGENTLFFDHVGGSGGGGSGGHVLLESAVHVDFTDEGRNDLAPVPLLFVSARGGAGASGFGTAGWSRGGDGGPGILQIHVPNALVGPSRHPSIDPTTSSHLFVPRDAAILADPLEAVTGPPALQLLPFASDLAVPCDR